MLCKKMVELAVHSHTVETPSTWVLLCDLEVKFDHAGMQTLMLQADDVPYPQRPVGGR